MDKTSEAILALKPTIGRPPFNVPNALQDPTLEVCDAPGALIMSNDNWQETQAANIQASGFAPPDPAEAAIIVVRPTGNTTAIVRGKNGARQADHLPHRAANEWRMSGRDRTKPRPPRTLGRARSDPPASTTSSTPSSTTPRSPSATRSSRSMPRTSSARERV